MKKHYLKGIFIIGIALLLASCVSPTKMIYLQNKNGIPLKENLWHYRFSCFRYNKSTGFNKQRNYQ